MIRLGSRYQHFVRDAACACCDPAIQRGLEEFTRRSVLAGAGATLIHASMPSSAIAQRSEPEPKTVFRQIRLFDGKSDTLRSGIQVLVTGNKIAAIDGTNSTPPRDALVIECGNRVLMPGMIDAHWHTVLAAVPASSLASGDPGLVFAASTAEAGRTLLRGFTTVRDMGGPVFSFKQAIDSGIITGPRIYPSGAMITTSGGHGDLRMQSELPRNVGQLSTIERMGGAMLADGVAEVQLRVREQLLQGASQIKVVGSGGVSSPRSPLDMLTFSETDLRASVDVARDWNTYVTVHAYVPKAIQRAIAAGAACIEHAHLMDESTAKLMADKDIWLSTQPFLSAEDSVPLSGPSLEKMKEVFAATPRLFELIRKFKINVAWGSDLLFSSEIARRQGLMLTRLSRWYSNAETLRMATSINGKLLALSNLRNPYPGKLGVVEEGALADLLLLNGNPLDNINLIEEPDANIAIIMKDGRIHKNTLRT
jgi:imidazolonepropionase-like amidohydrolase